MSLSETQGCQVEELSTLFPALCKFASKCSRRFGCTYPEQCGTDAVTEFLVDRNLRGEGRAEFAGEQIILHIPGAIDQSKVLYKLVWHEVRNKCFNCKECKYRNYFEQLVDTPLKTDEDQPRTRQAVGISPHNPEELFQMKELVAKSLGIVSNPVQRQELYLRGTGASYQEIAEQTKRAPQTIRQGVKRNKRRIASMLGLIVPRRKGK